MTMVRVMTVTLVVVLPGGLLVLLAWVLARTIVDEMRQQQAGTGGQRFARAVATVRLRDVWAHTRRAFLHQHA
jgi:hypothetical protein